MKYKTKIYLFFVGISSTLLIIASAVMIYEARAFVFRLLESQVISVAASAASQLDGNYIEEIKTRADMKYPAYTIIRDQLRKIRDSNRNQNVYIKYLYTVYPSQDGTKRFLFGIDAEESPKDVSLPADVDKGATEDLLWDNKNTLYSHGEFAKDQWGTWLTGYAPIYNSRGEYVGSVGADMSAAFINHVELRLLTEGGLILALSIAAMMLAAYFLAGRATRSLEALTVATTEIGKGNFSYRLELRTKDEFHDLAEALNKMAQGLLERERMKTGFAHYISARVMEKIIAGEGCKLEGEKRKITVLFSDIRGFTKIAETIPPEEVMSILNEYFGKMIDLVFKNNGILDKMIGDAIMAEYGSIADDAEQEVHAVQTALEMQRELSILREKWQKEGKPDIQIGIGIHTGEAVVGTVGSESSMQFTAIGDTVNTASRLEHVTREVNENIVISEEVHRALGEKFAVKSLGKIQLHGKEHPIDAYAVLSGPQQNQQ